MANDVALTSPVLNFAMAPMAPVQDEYSAALDATVMAALEGVFSSFRRITFARNVFHLHEGNSENVFLDAQGNPSASLHCVIINLNPKSHCSWWEGGWDPSSKIPPTACWWDGDVAPVPEWVLNTKKKEGTKEFKWYQKQRRCIVALLGSRDGKTIIDTDNLFVADMGEASMFTPDTHPQYSLFGILRLCQQYSTLPMSMVLKMTFDHSPTSAPSTVRFEPMMKDGQILFLDAATVGPLRKIAASSEVANLLKVRTSDQAKQIEAPAQQAPPAQQAAKPVQAAPAQQPVQTQPTQTVNQAPATVQIDSDLLAAANALINEPVQAAAPAQKPAPAQQAAPASANSELDAAMADLMSLV